MLISSELLYETPESTYVKFSASAPNKLRELNDNANFKY